MTVCGLVTRDQKPVPLRSISITVSVQGFVADVVSELRYQNEEKTPVEAVFVFPLDDEAAVYAFEGLIGGKQIEAQIREKKQAQQEYEDALSEGHEAFFLGREERTSDIFTCSLGNLHPDEEAVLKLRYVQALAPEPDGAIRFVLPAVLNPRYVPHDSQGDSVTGSIPRVPKGHLPYTLSLSTTLESPCGISRVESKCTLEPLQYKTEDQTIAQVSLAQGHQFDKDVELLIYYKDVHKPNAFLEAGKLGSATGSLMGDPVLLLTLFPSVPAPKPGQKAVGEFIFLVDRSGSMDCSTEHNDGSPSRIQSAKETLIFLLKSLPLGCYFNIYGFGSSHDSFYPQSVEYTQQTMLESLERVKRLKADLGGTEILQPLKAIYSQPCKEGQPRQVFVFTDGEVFNTDEVISEVRRHSSSHRCFSFGIGEGASTALIKGIARAAGGSAEFITGKERMQAKALQSLKKALQPAVTNISLNWTLPASLEAVLVGSGPQVIFQGQRCLIYAQITGQLQSAGSTEGTVVLKYVFQDQTFVETLNFPLHTQESDRFPVHRLAAMTLLQELEGAVEKEEEKQRLALETSLSSGVVCSQTAYVGVNRESGKTVQGPLARRDIPHAGTYRMACSAPMSRPRFARCCASPAPVGGAGHFPVYQAQSACRRTKMKSATSGSQSPDSLIAAEVPPPPKAEKEESPLLRLVFLQNADGSWPLDSALVNIFGLSESEISSKMPAQATSSTWATVLAILWLHSKAMEQKEEWELLEAKAVSWLQANAGSHLAECVKFGNTILKTSISPNVFGL